jgi:hypothetical protein
MTKRCVSCNCEIPELPDRLVKLVEILYAYGIECGYLDGRWPTLDEVLRDPPEVELWSDRLGLPAEWRTQPPFTAEEIRRAYWRVDGEWADGLQDFLDWEREQRQLHLHVCSQVQ